MVTFAIVADGHFQNAASRVNGLRAALAVLALLALAMTRRLPTVPVGVEEDAAEANADAAERAGPPPA